MAPAEAASIEQMNKVRLSLGLAPLPVPGAASAPQFKTKDETSDSEESDDLSTLDKRQAAAGSNWQKLEAEKKAQADRQARKEAAKKARDTAARNEKLQGKGLGDADEDDELDTRTWLLQQKKRQKKIEKARKLAEELAAREQQAEYTSKDLAGVKVGHEEMQFDEITGEQILTLKDAEIGEESEDDELENADLRAKERLEEKLRLKKKRPDYDPTEQEEQQSILSKYDEEIDGKKRGRFTLDGQGSTAQAVRRRADEYRSAQSKGVSINLNMLQEDVAISDYLDPSTVKVKKPKKSKKEKKSRQTVLDEDVAVHADSQPDAMDVDEVPTDDAGSNRKRSRDLDEDDGLQANLAEQRRQALKKRQKTEATGLAQQMRNDMLVDDEGLDDGGLMVDETSEFVANLSKDEDDSKSKNAQVSGALRSIETVIKTEPNDDNDEDGDANMGDEDDEDSKHGLLRDTSTPGARITATGLEDEEMASSSMAATVAMLRKRGIINDFQGDDRTAAQRQRATFLADKQHLIDEYDAKARREREADRASGRYDKLSNRERDNMAQQQNEAREQYIARLLADKFSKEYRPDVKLKYSDEFGREMNQREAFKHLSHMFHGKGSGKQKTEKHLKKIEDEKKNMAKGLLDIGEGAGSKDIEGRDGRQQRRAGVRMQ